MKPSIPVVVARRPPASPPVDDDAYDVDALLASSEKAARFAVDHGDGGVQEVAYWMDSLRLALVAIAVAVQELSRAQREAGR
jgi:hypothetical protein